VYVRPHELDIVRIPNGVPSSPAQVARVNEAGAVAKIGLVAKDGHAIQVDLAPQRFAELKLQLGETVYVLPRKVRVFPPEYSI
jgi:sulfate transport system ATP-binding protein